MKRKLICWFFMIIVKSVFAQQKDGLTISVDTINIRGVIFWPDRKPAKNIGIASRQLDFTYNKYPISVKTDTNGCFILNGAKPNDTLTIQDGRYYNIPFANKGSRYIVIYLPQPSIIETNSSNPIEVKAQRRYPRIKPSFHVHDDSVLDGGCTIVAYPRFPGGQQMFTNYIKQKLIYPEQAIRNNIEGTVEVGFTIERDGSLTHIKTIRGIGYGCDEQLIGLIKNGPKWVPGIYCSRPYSIEATISVKFSLTDN